jgi:hypothetical protein
VEELKIGLEVRGKVAQRTDGKWEIRIVGSVGEKTVVDKVIPKTFDTKEKAVEMAEHAAKYTVERVLKTALGGALAPLLKTETVH